MFWNNKTQDNKLSDLFPFIKLLKLTGMLRFSLQPLFYPADRAKRRIDLVELLFPTKNVGHLSDSFRFEAEILKYCMLIGVTASIFWSLSWTYLENQQYDVNIIQINVTIFDILKLRLSFITRNIRLSCRKPSGVLVTPRIESEIWNKWNAFPNCRLSWVCVWLLEKQRMAETMMPWVEVETEETTW